jgi:hypothetical protein
MRAGPSILLLFAFAAGGVVAPAVHRVHHEVEAGAVRAAHAEAGHHHHDAFGAHGLEWTPACDRPIVLDDLACVLCKGLHAGELPATPGLVAPSQPAGPAVGSSTVQGAESAGSARVRGPPRLIV